MFLAGDAEADRKSWPVVYLVDVGVRENNDYSMQAANVSVKQRSLTIGITADGRAG